MRLKEGQWFIDTGGVLEEGRRFRVDRLKGSNIRLRGEDGTGYRINRAYFNSIQRGAEVVETQVGNEIARKLLVDAKRVLYGELLEMVPDEMTDTEVEIMYQLALDADIKMILNMKERKNSSN